MDVGTMASLREKVAELRAQLRDAEDKLQTARLTVYRENGLRGSNAEERKLNLELAEAENQAFLDARAELRQIQFDLELAAAQLDMERDRRRQRELELKERELDAS